MFDGMLKRLEHAMRKRVDELITYGNEIGDPNKDARAKFIHMRAAWWNDTAEILRYYREG